jgi:hypothetical protein
MQIPFVGKILRSAYVSKLVILVLKAVCGVRVRKHDFWKMLGKGYYFRAGNHLLRNINPSANNSDVGNRIDGA